MENKHIILLRPIFLSLLITSISANNDNCAPASCGPTEPLIRYPFRIINHQPSSCGYPGFNLSCNKLNKTIIRLRSSRTYIVNAIDYVSQAIYIYPDFCGRNGVHSLNITGTPFEFSNLQRYTFYNCSLHSFGFMYPEAVPFPCLNSKNHSVVAVQPEFYSRRNMPKNCKVMEAIAVPVSLNGDMKSELELTWFNPYCSDCENDPHTGFPRSATYGLSFGIGMPVVICGIGLLCYAAFRARDYSETHHQSMEVFSVAIIPQPPSRTGLDGPTIESYPKTMLGESCRLSDDDSTCAICLSEYKAKESLRTIPECNHYFHADCIDEWLKLNATCPVCRNMPKSSSMVTPCSLAITTSTDS